MRHWFRRSILVLVLLGTSPVSASAQFIDFIDWLERLSGPGPFKGPAVRIPVACITETVGPSPEFTPELLPGCLGIRGFIRQVRGRTITDEKRAVLNLELKFGRLATDENPLPYAPAVTDEQKKVNIFVWGIGLRYLPLEATHVAAAWERYHFDGDLFERFDRDTFKAEIGVKPLWRLQCGERCEAVFRPITLSIGVVKGLGRFTAADFGATGNFQADDDTKPFIALGYDVWPYGRR